ncbi:MAG: hypothetical protein JSV56_02550 [Methanomassiliicoccales archaeon]|nr:MAG: hypothetical protein JSV56_02550 [Methanomassiliicoccales archaeon]
MTNKPLTTIGLIMPNDFPVSAYEKIHSRITAKQKTHPDSWSLYAGAWNAVAYRFYACVDHDKAFTESVQRGGSSPPQPERYIQEKELFCFFVTGLAVIESFCYGLFAIGSILDKKNFKIGISKELRSISPEKTTRQFLKAFPQDDIARELNQMINAQEFIDWKEIRNILTHRSAPGRLISLGREETLWIKGIQIDINTTTSKLKWLEKTMSDLLKAADTLTNRYL